MRVLVFIIWLLLGVFYWYVANNCCCVDTDAATSVVADSNKNSTNGVANSADKNAISATDGSTKSAATATGKKDALIGFDCDEDKPKLSARWTKYRDSLVSSLEDNQILQIKGYQFKDEKEDLALSRAENIKSFFNLANDKIRVVEGNYTEDCNENLEKDLITFRALRNTLKIKEVDDRTIIYFPFASTQKLNDQEVETYLDEVVERINKSGERVSIVGHTDNVGTPENNVRLGQGRANTIKNYFLSKGVAASKVQSNSKGEVQPIADNKTDKGRADNRRVELQIIK